MNIHAMAFSESLDLCKIRALGDPVEIWKTLKNFHF